MSPIGRSHAPPRASPSLPRARGKGGRSTGTGRSGERGVAALLLLGVTALAVSGLTSTYVPRLVLWRHGASCVPGDVAPCPPEAHHPDIDVVCVAVKPTCVTRVAIASINQYVAPRFIRFVSADAEACAALGVKIGETVGAGWADEWKVLQPEDVAASVVYAVTAPPHVAVNEVLIEPRDQE